MRSKATSELIDNGEQRDRRGRRMTPPVRRAELVEAWRRSGVTRAAFARREGLSYPTFAGWVQAVQRQVLDTSSIRFAEVRLPQLSAAATVTATGAAATGGLDVRLPDGTVLHGYDVMALAALVRALRI